MKKEDKLKIGFFSFACCEGCVISFLEVLNTKYFEYKEKFEIKYIKALKKVTPLKEFDIAFIEGAISNKNEEEKLKKIRQNAKKIVAIGSGAINGWPSNLRNDFDEAKQKQIAPIIKKLKQNKKILPIKEFVKVDDEIQGCPVEEKLFIEKINKYLQE